MLLQSGFSTMPNLQEILDTQKQLEESLGSRMAHFEKLLRPTSSSASVSKANLDSLSQEFNEFRLFVMDMFKLLRSQIDSLTVQLDDVDNYNRRNALLFHGLPEKENEDCTDTVVNLIQSTMNLKSIHASCIYLCHRLGAKNDQRARPVIVRFTDMSVRNIVWNTKKALKSSPTVMGEFLTKYRHDLFLGARKHFGVSSSWTSNGVVFVKTPDNIRNRISSASFLDKIILEFPLESIGVAGGSARVAPASCPKASRKQAGPGSSEAPLTRRGALSKGKNNK